LVYKKLAPTVAITTVVSLFQAKLKRAKECSAEMRRKQSIMRHKYHGMLQKTLVAEGVQIGACKIAGGGACHVMSVSMSLPSMKINAVCKKNSSTLIDHSFEGIIKYSARRVYSSIV
jgi:hypothetical protein